MRASLPRPDDPIPAWLALLAAGGSLAYLAAGAWIALAAYLRA